MQNASNGGWKRMLELGIKLAPLESWFLQRFRCSWLVFIVLYM